MVVLLGEIALLAVVVAACGAVALAARRVGRALLLAATGAGVVANGALAVLLVRGDWSVTYVVDHSRSDTSVLLRLAGLWAGAEGSFLLWTTLTCAAAVVAAHLARAPARPAAVRVGGVLAAVGGLVALTVLDPFDRLEIPAVTGAGMQPILEHPAMLWHPPLLYGGMLGLLVPTLLAATDRVPDRHVTRRATAVALGLLTAGLATGGRWAYAELGWGGYWGWDPVENVALVAWALGLAALHLPRRTPMVAQRLALGLPAVAVVWGTVLTRTYSVTSVHAFSSDPSINRAILALGVVSTVVPLVAAFRAGVPTAADPAADGADDTSRTAGPDSGLAAGRARFRWVSVALAGFVAVVVTAGTVAPMVREAAGGDESLVAGSYYAGLVGPAALAAGLVLAWFGRRWWLAG
ncbi:MAG: cytochrome c biogenesis protein CcsA, partial [Actinomycetota bacterium]|nr:cytochrome c biogenesis protein CcsA [Actinomycetota bacterium]